MSNLVQELKRRNVFRVAIAYIAIAWLTLQVADIVFENIGTPSWVMQTLMFLLAIGFPLAILFAWAYEMTPEGIKRESEVDREKSITHETGQKLNRTIIVVLLAAVGFLLVDKFLLQEPSPDNTTASATSAERSVAVLPFIAMSRGEDDEYFADGLTEEILNSLTRVPELLVTARTSSFHFKGQDIPIPQIADSLGVEHVVEGSVRRDGERLRVTAQLIRAADGFHIWSENYDRGTEDTFGVQTDIAEKIASALGIYLDDDAIAAMRSAGFRNPEAYVAFQKAVEIYIEAHNDYDSMPMLLEANKLLEQVIALEPRTSQAYLAHSDYYAHMLREAFSSLSGQDHVRMMAALTADLDAAVEVADTDELRLSASFDRALLTGNWAALGPVFDAYVEVANCPGVQWGNTTTLEFGKARQVLHLANLSIDCDPQSPFGYWDAVQANNWLGDFEAAIEVGERGMSIAPHANTWQALLLSYLGEGRYDDGERLVGRHATSEGSRAEGNFIVAAARGDRKRALDLMNEIVQHRADLELVQLLYFARAGDRESANRIAAKIDAQPAGYLSLMSIPSGCFCGAPWDLEVTPNYAALIEEAGFEWPPVAPITWPLKDW